MRVSVKTLIWYLATHCELKAPIVDLGARQSPNQLIVSDLRPLFPNREYIGCDMSAGVGVDKIENIEALTFKDSSIPTVLCLDTIEHVENPIKAFQEISRIITEDGIVIVSSHMYAPIHYDPDYWRFTPRCFGDILLKDFQSKILVVAGEELFPELVIGIATKAEKLPFDINYAELNSMLPWSYPFGLRPVGAEEQQ